MNHNMTGTKLYIDSEGVTRGYYVYLHKDLETGVVFYVGKGNGQRAWDTARRNTIWKQKVSTLTNGWSVEIVEQDLTESEAFDLEAELVEQYGGCAAEGGTLTNWILGVEHPVSISLSFELPDDNGNEQVYQEARIFKNFPRTTSETFIKKMINDLDSIVVSLQHLEKEAKDKGDELLGDSVFDLDSCLNQVILAAATDFLRHRLSWKDLALMLEEAHDEIDLQLWEDIDECHEKVWPLRKETHKIMSDIMELIDSGNRDEAEEIATRKTTAPAAEQGDANAQANLGYRYTMGRGVPQDDVQAYKWYSIAEAQGQSGLLFDILKERMTSSQIAKAERLSQEWLNRKNK